MFNAEICFFSPLCIKTVHEGHYPALLLQFILAEIFNMFQAAKSSDPFPSVLSEAPSFFPYDWSHKIGSLIKIQEYARLLQYAFPLLIEEANQFNKCLKTMIAKVEKAKNEKKKFPEKQFQVSLKKQFWALIPFLTASNNDENLLLFLLKTKQNYHELLFPDTFENLLNKIELSYANLVNLVQKKYQDRGFNLIISETESIPA